MTDRPLKQSKRPRKCADPTQCRAKGNPISDAKFSRRSSAYRGVTRHRWTGRFEAHLWDKSSYNCTQTKKGKQVYLGAYDSEVDAARTYDLAALKYWGLDTILNFPKENYTKEVEEMQNVSKQDYLASIRRSSSGFSRGVSKYRGVARHHHNGRWEARIGRVFGNKYLYLGTFSSQEEAAKAYDLAAIQYRGRNAVTNFDISNYIPKEEPEHDENPSSAIETKPDQLPPNQDQEQEEKHPPLISAQTSEESELVDTFNDSPITLTDALSWKNEPWSFCMDAGGYDPLCLPNAFHNEEEDSILFDRHVIHKEEEEEEDSSLFYRRVFHEEEKDSNLFDLDVFRNEEEDSNLLDLHVFHSEKEDSNLFDLHDSNLFDVLDEEDSNLFDVLDEKAFEDDIHLIYNDDEEGKWECVDGVEKEGCKMKEEKIDKSCFDSSSSSSTVTTDLF